SRRRHTRWPRDWSSDVCSSDLIGMTKATTSRAAPNHLAIACPTGTPRGEWRATASLWFAHGQIVRSTISRPASVTNQCRKVDGRSEERRVGKEGRKRRRQED